MMRYTMTPDRIVFGPELFYMNFMDLNVLYLKNHTIPRFGLWRKRRRRYYCQYPSLQLRYTQNALIRPITRIMPTLEIF